MFLCDRYVLCDFPESKNLFQSIGLCFLVESIKIENASFP